MFDLTTRDIKFISGVGPQKAAVLNKELEIYSLYDLIYYFPYKYVDRSRIYYIHEIDGNMPICHVQIPDYVLCITDKTRAKFALDYGIALVYNRHNNLKGDSI